MNILLVSKMNGGKDRRVKSLADQVFLFVTLNICLLDREEWSGLVSYKLIGREC